MLTNRYSGLSRVVGVVVGLCLTATVGVAGGVAQDAEATPTTEATPAAEEQLPAPEFEASAADRTRMAEYIQQVSDAIALVQGDRDAVSDRIETQTVDELLAQAVTLRDDARTALDGDDASGAPAKLIAAHATTMAASELIRAQLAAYGLPSQQAAASRILVNAYYQVKAATDRARDGAEAEAGDAEFYITAAQELYRQAYDLYNAGAYEGAGKTARVAAQVSHIAAIGADGFTIKEAHVGVAPGADTVVIEGPHAEGKQFEIILPPGGVAEGRHGAISDGVTVVALPDIAGSASVAQALPGDFFFGGPALMAGDTANQSPLEVPEPEF